MLRTVLGAFLCLCSWWAQADTPSLKVALFDVVPYAALADGKPRGLYVEWVRDFLGAQGIRADIELLPFGRIPVRLQQREADLTISFATEALDQVALPLGPVLHVDSLVVTGAARRSTQLASLHGTLLGRARGGCQDLAQRVELQLHWVEVRSFDSGLRMLELGRLDGLCLTRDVLKHYLAALGMDRDKLGPEIVVSQRVASLFARKTLEPALTARLQEALSRRVPMRRD